MKPPGRASDDQESAISGTHTLESEQQRLTIIVVEDPSPPHPERHKANLA